LAFAKFRKLLPVPRFRNMGLPDCLKRTIRRLHILTTTLGKGLGRVITEGDSSIVPVMMFNAKLSQDIARDLFYEGISLIGLFFPVVPAGQAPIRTQMSADRGIPQLAKALDAFKKIGAKHGIPGLDEKGIIEEYGI
jgi:7-keto-8-aminopelargonate synthetase-like enzyme